MLYSLILSVKSFIIPLFLVPIKFVLEGIQSLINTIILWYISSSHKINNETNKSKSNLSCKKINVLCFVII